ncbi:MAG: cytidylate kinase-like family protein [Lachnospiraceae bacterium]|nr:cytidylate kinase-like family protein [Lachnospiraceae bacterium]
MDKRIIITIGRQYGSGGHEIGEKIAKNLGINFYDKNLIELTAARSGLNPNVINSSDERAPSIFSSTYSPTISDQLFAAQRELIKTLTETESFVIVGRCANAIIREYAPSLDVFLFAPMDLRIKRCMDLYLIETEEKARHEIARIDRIRKNYYQYYTDFTWGSMDGHDLILDTSILGIDGTADFLTEFAKKVFTE